MRTVQRFGETVGAKEAEAGNISVRDRKGETTEMSLEDFIAQGHHRDPHPQPVRYK